MMRFVSTGKMSCLVAIGLMASLSGSVFAGEKSDLFVVRKTGKSTEAIIQSIKSHSEARKWQYLGASAVKKGEVMLVKVCMPEIGKLVWPQGKHMGALLPCGNFAVYKSGDQQEVSMLHPRYMHLLVPTLEMEAASTKAEPLLNELLEAAVK